VGPVPSLPGKALLADRGLYVPAWTRAQHRGEICGFSLILRRQMSPALSGAEPIEAILRVEI
jgi:hypothetical protein